MARHFHSLEESIDALLDRVGKHIRLGIPLGIGKPNPWVNALYRRVKSDSRYELHIFTALSLEKPSGNSELESRFLDPFVERVFGNYPDFDYVKDLRAGKLPSNIQVSEFFFKTGDYLHNDVAQQHYICSNYTHVARDMVNAGINVMAQAIGYRDGPRGRRYSLGSNPDVALDMRDLMLERGTRKNVMIVGVLNDQMPFMPNDAEVNEGMFDFIVDDAAGSHTLFGAPNMKVTLQDYCIGLHASTLVKDGGTLQIGIGSLGDAIAHSLILRDGKNDEYRRIIRALNQDDIPDYAELEPFNKGLYGCSEMFVNGFMQLIKANIIRREVFPDARLQRLFNDDALPSEVCLRTIEVLNEEGLISFPLDDVEIAWLQRYGILKDCVKLEEDKLVIAGERCRNNLKDPHTRQHLAAEGLGSRYRGGIYMHGGFFLGPQDFYQALRDMPEEKLNGIGMSRISYINQLYGHETIARLQRRDARLMNTTMMVTLGGAAVSDGLENGHLVSGVGGQYNFVAMGHALPDARSILMLRAVRDGAHGPSSNIVWNYGHVTIPRHLRDIVITEYGVADIRGQCDSEVAKRLLMVADSRFQQELLATAKANGKIEAGWEIPDACRNNLPETLQQRLSTWVESALPAFPFGTDFTDDELKIVKALMRLKASTEHPLDLLKTLVSSIFGEKDVPERYLQRMHLDEVDGLKMKLVRQLFMGNF